MRECTHPLESLNTYLKSGFERQFEDNLKRELVLKLDSARGLTSTKLNG